MKTGIILLIIVAASLALQAQVSKTLNVTAGGLSTALTTEEKNTITNLTLSGTIDARDFKTMRDDMPLLTAIDLSGVTVVEYTGTEGTYNSGNITFPADAIPDRAFYNTSTDIPKISLASVVFPSKVTVIGEHAFRSCRGLTSVSLPSSLMTIKALAFYGCTSLYQVILPSSVNTIGYKAFENCTGLTSISIPQLVTSIGSWAFSGCDNISGIIALPVLPVNLGSSESVFSGLNKTTTTLNVPFGTKNLYAAAAQWKDFVNIIEMPGLFLSTDTLNMGTNAGTASVMIYSSANWTAISDQIWLTLDPVSGSTGSGTITLSATTNPSVSNRMATVTISATGLEPKTIEVNQYGKVEVTAGSLRTILGSQLATITNLTLTGTIDARDFKTMRDEMPMLLSADLSGVTVVEYEGTEGTYSSSYRTYPANAIPDRAFYQSGIYSSNIRLSSLILPLSVISIGNEAFESCRGLTTVSFPSSLITIGDNAFQGCTHLNPVNFPSSLTTIGRWAFYNCTDLKSVNIPPSVTNISSFVFYNCTGLLTVFIPHSVTVIGDYAFSNSSGLFTVDENNTVYSSYEGVLYNKSKTLLIQCPVSKTGSFTFPSTVLSVGNAAFSNCKGLTSVYLPTNLSTIGNDAFRNCTSLTSVHFPETLVSIGPFAFEECTGLISINIPSSVSSIGFYAFVNCRKVTMITSLPVVPVNLESSPGVFDNIDKTLTTLNVPFGTKTLYQSASQWKDFVNIIEMPGLFLSTHTLKLGANAGTARVLITSSTGWTAISDQSWLTVDTAGGSTGTGTITLSATANQSSSNRTATVTFSAPGLEPQTIAVTQYSKVEVTAGNLGTILASQLTSITNLTLSGTIDARDFKTMRDEIPLLAAIDLSGVSILQYTGPGGTCPSSWGNHSYPANSIPEKAFYNGDTYTPKTSLVSIILPSSLVSIGVEAFSRCSGLHSVNIPSSVTSIGDNAFYYCMGLISVNIPTSVTSISSYAFYNCNKLSSIFIPFSVTTIGDRAFSNSSGSFTVDINNPAFSSADGVLYNKSKTSIIQCPVSKTGSFTVPSTVLSVGNAAFSNCKGLTSVYLPPPLYSIGNDAFISCTSLTSVNMPSSLVLMGSKAFEGCTGLSSINIPSSVTFIGSQAFGYCSNISTITALPFEPVNLESSPNVFISINKTTATLNVPSGTKILYAAASQWKDFTNIVEINGIVLSVNSLNMGAGSDTSKVNVASGVDWTAVSDQSWLTLDHYNGSSGTATITLSATNNLNTTKRIATVTFSAPGFESQTILVIQYGRVEVTAGNLRTLLTDQLATITNLTLTGTIDARDFKTMRDEMPLLKQIDLKNVTVLAYSGKEGTSGTSITTYPANAIPYNAFYNINTGKAKTILTAFILPTTVTTIGYDAFYQCSGLTAITFSPSLISVGTNAFDNCTSLTSINIPSSVTSVGSASFRYCRSLTSVFIPASVTSIGNYAFQSSGGLITVDPKNANYSSSEGVLFNKSRTTLIQCPLSKTGNYTIPSSVITIGTNSFYDCKNLNNIIIPTSVISIESNAFWSCSGLSTIYIPASVTSIGSSVFGNCININKLYAYPLSPVNLSSSYDVFYNINKSIAILYVPFGTKTRYAAATQWKDFNNIIELPGLFLSASALGMSANAGTAQVTLTSSASWSAVSDQPWLTLNKMSGIIGSDTLMITATANPTTSPRSATVTVSASGVDPKIITVTQYNIVEVTAGNLRTVLSEQLSSITSLTLYGIIDARDFKTMRDEMPLLTAVDLSHATIVTYTGTEGTYGTSNYTYPANTVPNNAFYNSSTSTPKKSLISVVFPSSVTSIGNWAFYLCSGLISINLPASLTHIGDYAFNNCTGLATISFPPSLSSLGNYAFDNCTGITSLFIASTLTSIGTYSLRGIKGPFTVDINNPKYLANDGVLFDKAQTTLIQCPSAKTGNYTIPSTVISIVNYAFYNCSGLTSVTIPGTVTSIGTTAFGNCSNVSSIYVQRPVPVNLYSSSDVFHNINKTACTLFVPYGSKALYTTANQWKDFANTVEMQGLFLSANTLEMFANATTTLVFIASSVTWTAVSDQTWLTIIPASGTAGNDTIAFTTTDNPETSKRYASVTVSASGFDPKTIAITQNGAIEITAGNLRNLLSGQLASITNLTLSGTIDARDFKTMRDDMPLLTAVDLSHATIVTYTGTEGTYVTSNYTYPANTVPNSAFYNSSTSTPKTCLQSFAIPSSATSIGYRAFYYCSGLISINLAASLTLIGDYAFNNCTGLATISFPPSLSSLGNYTFENCTGLSSLFVPATLTSIGTSAFRRINGFFTVDANNPKYSAKEGVLFDKAQNTLIQCPVSKTGNFVIPSTVMSIGNYAFSYCSGLASVTIPATTTSIGNNAFSYCYGLTSVILPGSVSSIGSYAFDYCYNIRSIYVQSPVPLNLASSNNVFYGILNTICILYVPFGTKTIYSAANQWKDFSNIVEMPGIFLSANALSLGDKAGSVNIVLTSSVSWTAVSDQAWLALNHSSGIVGSDTLVITATANMGTAPRYATVTVSAPGTESKTISVMQYGKIEVTAGNLRTVLSGELATITSLSLSGTIDARDFKTMRDEMPSLIQIDLSNVIIVAYTGAEGTYSTSTYSYPANAIPDRAFYNSGSGISKTGLTSIILPPTVTIIGGYAFYRCSGLVTITLSPSLISIGDYACNQCSKLNSVDIPSGVTKIGINSFASCTGLTSVNIPASVIAINSNAFYNSSGLFSVDENSYTYSAADGILFNKTKTNLIQCPVAKTGSYSIPSTVSVIGSYAFYNCTGLTSVTIPSSVTAVNNNAFEMCNGFTSVNIPSSVTSIGNYAFYNCGNLATFNVPLGVTSIGSYAFGNCNKVSSIYAYPVIPVNLSSSTNVFANINKTTTILYVPYQTKALYAAAVQWKDFLNMVEQTGFKLSATAVNMEKEEGSTASVDITSDVTWTASSDQSWLTVSPATGTATSTIQFTALANTNPLPRVAKVTISSPGVMSQTITVTQGFPVMPLTGFKTINPVGGDFTSFTDALTMLNNNGAGPGGVTFLVAAGTTYFESTLNIQTSSSSASNPVIFRKDGNGANPVIYGEKPNGTTMDYIIRITGSDYITFDGIDLASNPATLADLDKIEAGWYIPFNTNTDGCDHITIRNCKITIERKTNTDNQYGINISQSASLSAGTHSNILIDHVQFVKGRTCLYISGSVPNENIEIKGCKFGEPGTITEPLIYTSLFGNCRNISFHDNEIQNIAGPNPSLYAVYFSSLYGTNAIYNNKIHGVRLNRTEESAYLYGLAVSSADPAAEINIYNNLIYDLDGAKSVSDLSNLYWNIRMLYLSGAARFRVYNNTITGTSVNPHESTALCYATPSTELKNNIFADFSVPGAFSFRTILPNNAGIVENNLYWIDESLANNYTYSNQYKFKEWQKGVMTPSDGYYLNNVLGNPLYSDPDNFDFTFKPASPASNNGQPAGFITTDLKGSTRNPVKPDIGAFEADYENFTDLYPPVIRFQPLPANAWNVIKLMTTITDNIKVAEAKLWFRVRGTNNTFDPVQGSPSGNIWEFTFPALISGEYEYFVCAKDSSGNISSNGYMTSGLSAALTGLVENAPPVNPDYVYSFAYKKGIPVLYNCTVGNGGTFGSLTKPGGLFDMINKTVINGNIVATIVSDLDETGEIDLMQWREAGTGNYTLTIKPGDASLKTISNPTSNPIGFTGADRIIIDGSFKGDNLNHLKFTTTSNYSLYFYPFEANGCTNITIKNCDLFSGIYCIYASGNNFSDFLIDHVYAVKGTYGLYFNSINNLAITNCTVGNTDVNNSITYCGIYMSSCSNIVIEKNTIQNIIASNSTTVMGIYLTNITGSSMNKNRIINVQNNSGGFNSSNGLFVYTSKYLTISNNIISGINGTGSSSTLYSSGIKGVVIYNCGGIKFWYNTVNLFGTGNTNSGATCFSITTELSYNSQFCNNVFSNTITNSGTTYTNGIIQNTRELSNVFRNNINYIGGTKASYPYRINETGNLTLPAWRSYGFTPGDGRDLGSGLGDPRFTNSAAHDVSLQSSSPALNSGIQLPVTTDFYGNPRSLTSPDIGAIEDNSMNLVTDIIPPVISYTPLNNSMNLNPELSASITDNKKVTAAKMWYRVKGTGNAFTGIEGAKQAGDNIWKFTVSDPLIPGNEYEYFVCAKDSAGNIITNGITDAALDVSPVGLTDSNPAANPLYVRTFKVSDLSISLGTISGSPFYASYKNGAPVEIPFIATGSFMSNVFEAFLSDATGNFTNETKIGSLTSNTSGTISAVIPGASAGAGFRIRVKSTNPSGVVSSASEVLQVIIDNTNPHVTLVANSNTPVSGPFKVTIRYSEVIRGFLQSMISVSNATLSNFSVTVPDKEFTVLVNPVSSGEVTLQVAADRVTDLAGNFNGASDLLSLFYIKQEASMQTIPLATGWNIFSTNLEPGNLEMKTLFQSLINDGSLVKVQDESGNSMEDYGIFGGWTDEIGKVFLTEGYKVKVTRDCQLQVSGLPAPLPVKIPLKAGWNIIGFPKQAEAEAQAVVQQLIDRNTLVKVQDETGNAIEDWGAFGGWQNMIGNFKPGKGYKIKVSANDTLTIFESYTKSSASPLSHATPVHFITPTTGNGVDHMNINLVDIPEGLLQEEDEIGVFDGDLCVGAIKICNLQSAICNLKSEINNKESVIRNISIPVPASDGSGMAGFTEGHPILMKVWKADTNREYLAEAEILKGTATFVKHESSLVSLKNLRIRRLGDLATWRETDMNGIRIFPNPTAGKIYFTTGSHSTGELIIQVFNAPGQAVMNKVIKAGPGMIDLSGHAPGIYYISITLDSYTKTEKVMLR